MIRKRFIVVAAVFCFFFFGCGKKEYDIAGKAMGTSYHIKAAVGFFVNKDKLGLKIDKRLSEIEAGMSAFLETSELSRFNAFDSEGELFEISKDFAQVMETAFFLYKITEGAWDGSVKPAVDLWGFGASGKKVYSVPDKKDIKRVSEYVGFDKIAIKDKKYLIKKDARITIDLGSIAKGYAVDEICNLLTKEGVKSFIVEIGGEVKAKGLKVNGKKWRAGINLPEKDAFESRVYNSVKLFNKAMAVSGDYRFFFERDKRMFSHIIDSRSCMPVKCNPASVAVIAADCITADGLATGLMVLGRKRGLELINRMEDVECQIIMRNKDDNKFSVYYSNGFRGYIAE
ncbi:MAG: FAD:protein FMN transferase [Deltaproteobacteria bacterium]|nr:FAD:protein FMN transferase [Deltaproteobacteria bacterium]